MLYDLYISDSIFLPLIQLIMVSSGMIFASILGGYIFFYCARKKMSSQVREFVMHHATKQRALTLAGVYIIAVILLGIVFCTDTRVPAVQIIIFCLIAFGLLGATDDMYKVYRGRGIQARTKFICQLLASGIVAVSIYYHYHQHMLFPFINYAIPLGVFYIVWAMLVIISASNAVNLTDGIDGLAATLLIYNFIFFGIASYILPGVDAYSAVHVSRITFVVAATLVGYLWHNTYPARLIMGDVGSLALGGLLGCIALLLQAELLLPLSGILFVAETVSVMLQVMIYKRYKKRLFKMAPLHHHFELSGFAETTLVQRFGLITLVICLILIACLLC